jgi:hypothetical protein
MLAMRARGQSEHDVRLGELPLRLSTPRGRLRGLTRDSTSHRFIHFNHGFRRAPMSIPAMSISMPVSVVLLSGAIGGAVVVLVANLIPRYARHILAIALVLAAMPYVHFAHNADAGALWLTVELAGVCLYGGMAAMGVRRSLWWLVAGWALHPVWDMALHYVGPGRAFAPEPYAVACLSWDLVVAGYIAYRVTRAARVGSVRLPGASARPPESGSGVTNSPCSGSNLLSA